MSAEADDPRPAGGQAPRAWRHLTILETLGEDAAAAVYRAYDRTRQEDVVLKLQWPAASASLAARAIEDARLKMRARHPNIAAVYGAGEADGRVGVWAEFVRGETLSGLLTSNGPFDPRDAARIGLALCGALSAVHDAGLYGDVRAHKVMRADGGGGGSDRIVLLDFGIEPALDAHASVLLYQPPETFAGRRRTPAADIHGLGVLLFHLVTNTYPVTGDTFDEIRRAHEAGTRRRLNEVRARLPKEFVHAVEHSIAPDPLDRYQTIGALEVTLARYLGPGTSRYEWLRLPWVRVAAAVLAAAVAASATLAYRRVRLRQAAAASSTRAPGTGDGSAGGERAIGAMPYTISAALYRESGNRARLRALAELSPGDEWSIEVLASVPMHVYVVAENERGEADLLYPTADQAIGGPIPAGTATRLPGGRAAGSGEHVLVVASPERLPALEHTAPRPDANQGERARLSAASVEFLRTLPSSGAPGPAPGPASLASRFPTPLPENSEPARGVWVRRISLR